jgi:cobyrinic acid a,c-diamide synthase
MNNGFIIAGTNSGSGKTTVTIGLMRLLCRQGYRVAPFKTGPDYIDPAFHSVATATDSHNLDTYLLGEETARYLFAKYSHASDVAVVEGVMGMFDGIGDEGGGSTAELSRVLGLPVILVVSCKALYQSVAAIVNGFVHFDKRVHVAGVILNHVYDDEQFAFLQHYIETHCGVACLGYLPPDDGIGLESRHLGLIQAGEVAALVDKTDRIADLMAQHIDIVRLLEVTRTDGRAFSTNKPEGFDISLQGLKLGVAYDKAFSFYYRANLDLLEENGAELHYFSPLADAALPAGINALYLGGGYPEVFARELSENRLMLESIRAAAESGTPVYAECGGLMYLTEGIRPTEGEFYLMCGVFGCRTEMTARLQHFGYCRVGWSDVQTLAHEFHHSQLIPTTETPNYRFSFEIEKPENHRRWQGGLSYKNVLAGYPHIHFYSDAAFFRKLVGWWNGIM